MSIYKWIKKRVLLYYLRQDAKMYKDITLFFCDLQLKALEKDYTKSIATYSLRHSIHLNAIKRIKKL